MSYSTPARVAWLDVPGGAGSPTARLYLARVPDGVPLVLDDPARSIWLAARTARSRSEVVTRVAQDAQVPAEEIMADVEGFLAELVALGLLVQAPDEEEP